MQPLQLKALHIAEPSFSIPGYFDQLQDDVFAYRGSGTRFVDFTFALPREGCHLCSTLYKEAGDETWTILEWCDNIQAIEDLNAPLPSDGPCEIIVIASRKGIAPRDIGLQLIDDDVALTPVTVKAVMAFRHLSKSKPRLRPHCVMKPIRLMIPSLSTVRTERADDRRVDSELALDFCFTARADGDEKLCCLVVSDSHSKWVQAWPVKAKGGVAARNYITTEFVKCTRAEAILKAIAWVERVAEFEETLRATHGRLAWAAKDKITEILSEGACLIKSAPRYPVFMLMLLEALVFDVGHATGWRIWAWAKLVKIWA
eukprot:s6672_g1.t1